MSGKSKPFIKIERGYSILELVIAMAILSVGLLGLATMVSSGIGSGRFGQMVTVESSLASAVMEEIMSRDGSDAIFSSTVQSATYDLDADTASTTRQVQGRTYSATYSIMTSTPVQGCARVDVTVTSGGRSRTMTSIKSTV